MNSTTIKAIGTAVLSIGIMLCPIVAGASTVDKFSFVQEFYTGGGTLTGTFTGTVEANGFIEEADLSAFNATFSINEVTGTSTAYFYLTDLHLFSFQPAANGPNSSLDFYAQTPGLGQNSCVGAAATFGLCGSAGNDVGYANTIGASVGTADFPVLTLVSSTTTPLPANTPEPATYALSGLALMLVGASRWRRRESIRIGRQ